MTRSDVLRGLLHALRPESAAVGLLQVWPSAVMQVGWWGQLVPDPTVQKATGRWATDAGRVSKSVLTDILRRVIIAVVNLKGGSTKTTTAAFMAHVLYESGLLVLGVDADAENESLLSWSEQASFPFPVIGLPVRDLHRQLPGIAGDRYDAVVIDTPPMKESRGIVLSAARMADHVVVPMAPTSMEYNRLPAVKRLLDDAADLRPDGARPPTSVLFTRTVPNASSTEVYRQAITEDGYRVLPGEVRRLEQMAQAFGNPITGASSTAYGDAVAAILGVNA